MNRHFTGEDIHMANKRMQKCWSLGDADWSQVRYYHTPVCMGQIKKTVQIQYWNSHPRRGDVKWYTHFGKQAASQNVEHTPTTWSRYSTPWYSPKRNESVCSEQDFRTNVHRSFICNNRKRETVEMSVSRGMDLDTVALRYTGRRQYSELLTRPRLGISRSLRQVEAPGNKKGSCNIYFVYIKF